MKLPAFVKKITAKKNAHRSSSASSSADNVGVAAGLHRHRSLGPGDIEKDEQLPPRCIPSIDVILSEHHVDTVSLSSSNNQHLETQAKAPLHLQRLSDRSGDSLSIDDNLAQVCGGDDTINSKLVPTPTQHPSQKKSMSMNSFSMLMTSLSHSHHGMENETGKCPFKHGTVYSGPYPGYAHGNPKRGICPNGCKAQLNSVITEDESTAETMMREAMEYLELYYHERNEDMSRTKGFLPKKERMAQVRKAIHETGTYVHTFDELGTFALSLFFIL